MADQLEQMKQKYATVLSTTCYQAWCAVRRTNLIVSVFVSCPKRRYRPPAILTASKMRPSGRGVASSSPRGLANRSAAPSETRKRRTSHRLSGWSR
jgi:hypothetical protein